MVEMNQFIGGHQRAQLFLEKSYDNARENDQ